MFSTHHRNGAMKYAPRLGIFKAANVTFDPSRCVGKSYDWWIFVTRTSTGKVVFNNYTYSPTTTRHQSKMRDLLKSIGVRVDAEIESPDGLQSPESAIALYGKRIQALHDAIGKKGSRKAKNAERLKAIAMFQKRIGLVKTLFAIEDTKTLRVA